MLNTVREQYKEYINKVMSSSFGEENLQVTHNCGNKKATQPESSDDVEIDEDLEHKQNKHDKSRFACVSNLHQFQYHHWILAV